jgi:trehalose synthase-fused probable maltokinase
MTGTELSERLLNSSLREELSRALPVWLGGQRWFGGKARAIESASVVECLPLTAGCLSLAAVRYADGGSETYLLVLAAAGHGQVDPSSGSAARVVLNTTINRQGVTLYDAWAEPAVARELLNLVAAAGRVEGIDGSVSARPTGALAEVDLDTARSRVKLVGADQSNSSLAYGEQLILKLFRRLEEGLSPDLELTEYLTDRVGFPHTAPLAGAIEYVREGQEPRTIAMLQRYVPNQGDAWSATLADLKTLCGRLAETPSPAGQQSHVATPLAELLSAPPAATDRTRWERPHLLGKRTGQLHLALASDSARRSFAPEPLSIEWQRALAEAVDKLTRRTLRLLEERLDALAPADRVLAASVVGDEQWLLRRLAEFAARPIAGLRIRCHGDYHLGQVLWTGDDFTIIDFEGEPTRSLAERREKHSPLKDVAGMLRSFDYARHVALAEWRRKEQRDDASSVAAGLSQWLDEASRAFLAGYRQEVDAGDLLPPVEDLASRTELCGVYLLEKAVYELSYELNNRPDWVSIPLAALAALIE